MIERNIIQELMEKLEITRIGVYKKIEKTQKDLKIVDSEIAAYCLAFQNDIKLKKYNIDPRKLEKVESALRNQSTKIPKETQKKSKRDKEHNFSIKIGTQIQFDHPILPKQILKEAEKMADLYPVFYVFENSVRKLIQQCMESKFGNDWWKKATISSKIKQKVETRQEAENNNKWHGKRGAHPIFYTDIEELTSIIENNWNEFASIFPQKQHWIKTMIEIIGTSRNVVAHNNPLSDDDISAVKVHFTQWINQIKDIEFESAKK